MQLLLSFDRKVFRIMGEWMLLSRDSVLNSLSYFHVCDNTMPPDFMHDVLEGYLPYTLHEELCVCLGGELVYAVKVQMRFEAKHQYF